MIRISQLKLHIGHGRDDLSNAVLKRLRLKKDQLLDLTVSRRSIDARDKDNIRLIYTVDVSTSCDKYVLDKLRGDRNISGYEPCKYSYPMQGSATLTSRPCIIGAGPAGLFCAYFLARSGYRPILIEQGEDVESRKKTVEAFFSEAGRLDPLSNIQFGEGGAGAFSDGKLTSGVKDISGRKTEVLKTFVQFGAPKEILCSSKPHVGTDILVKVIKGIRQAIIYHGGTVLFNTKFIDYACENGSISQITVSENGTCSDIPCSVLVLATGHSSRDTFSLLKSKNVSMQSKPFAVGVRVQHPQELINRAQYGQHYKEKYHDLLPAADYKLTAKTADGRSVYSFCMCPGGYVINSSSENGMLCVNGMSYSGRSGANANSAIIVSISPDDIGALDDPMKAVEFQRTLEKKAYDAGSGRIPSQRLEDFYLMRKTREFTVFKPQTKGLVSFADINEILPGFICRDLKEAFEMFGKVIKGFDDPDTILSAVESRTSSPIRIPRDESLQSISVSGLYPCGEGAGYAGGITSSSIDGIKVFEEIYKKYRP